MTSASTTARWTCTTCRFEIHQRPVFHIGLVFCCAGCVADGPCICSYDVEPLTVPGPMAPAPSADAAAITRTLVGAGT